MSYSRLSRFFIGIILLGVLSGEVVSKPIKIVAITEDFASIAKDIGGDLVDVSSLIKGSRNLHHINPKPSMVMKVKSADLLIRLGMQQDSWIDSLIHVARNSRVFPNQNGYLDASHGIQKLEVPTEKLSGQLGDVHKHGNPHYWLDPENGKHIAKKIRDHLKQIDQNNKDVYDENYMVFRDKLDEKIKEWQDMVKPLSRFQIVTYHKVWSYFFEAFNLNGVGELETLPGIPPTTRHLVKLKSIIEDSNKPKLVITASYYPRDIGQSFAKDIDGHFEVIPANVGESGISSYVELFDFIIAKLTK